MSGKTVRLDTLTSERLPHVFQVCLSSNLSCIATCGVISRDSEFTVPMHKGTRFVSGLSASFRLSVCIYAGVDVYLPFTCCCRMRCSSMFPSGRISCRAALWMSDFEAAQLSAQVLPLSALATTQLRPTRNARDGPVLDFRSPVSDHPVVSACVQDLSCCRLTACGSHKAQHE